MPTFCLNKLVRDNIPELNSKAGITSEVKELKDTEFAEALIQKLKEEAEELRQATTTPERAKELSDIQDVLAALIETLKITKKDINAYKQARNARAGGFTAGYFISTITIPDDHAGPWLDYYRREPEKYPEVIKD